MNGAQLSETQSRAQSRHVSFHEKIAASAARLAAAKVQPAPAAPSTSERAAPVAWGFDPCDAADHWLSIVWVEPNRRISIKQIQRAVCDHFGLEMGDMTTARRTGSVVRPRQIAMALSKMLTPASLPEIGRRFGGRDHTTALHAVRRIEYFCAVDPQFSATVAKLRSGLEGLL